MTSYDFKQDSFDSWLAKQPASREFDFTDAGACLIASWLKETGALEDPSVTTTTYKECGSGVAHQLPGWLQSISNKAIALDSHLFTVEEFLAVYRP